MSGSIIPTLHQIRFYLLQRFNKWMWKTRSRDTLITWKVEGKIPFWRPKCKRENKTKIYLRKIECEGWTGLNRITIGSSGRLLWIRERNFWFHKRHLLGYLADPRVFKGLLTWSYIVLTVYCCLWNSVMVTQRTNGVELNVSISLEQAV
jgi:hypothetical protein